MRKVAILGVGMIPFGRRDEDSLLDMLSLASLNAIDDAGIGDRPVDAVYVGNMAAGLFNHQTAIASALVDRINLLPAPADTVENGPASGASTGVYAVRRARRSSIGSARALTARQPDGGPHSSTWPSVRRHAPTGSTPDS